MQRHADSGDGRGACRGPKCKCRPRGTRGGFAAARGAAPPRACATAGGARARGRGDTLFAHLGPSKQSGASRVAFNWLRQRVPARPLAGQRGRCAVSCNTVQRWLQRWLRSRRATRAGHGAALRRGSCVLKPAAMRASWGRWAHSGLLCKHKGARPPKWEAALMSGARPTRRRAPGGARAEGPGSTIV